MRHRNCHRCHTPILIGVDDHGVDVELDATPLNLTGEALAIIGGWRTWLYTIGNRRIPRELWKRTPHHIGSDPGSGTLHTTHICGQPIPAAWTQPLPAPPQPTTDTEVPF